MKLRHSNQYSTRDPRPLYWMLASMALCAYLNYRFQPMPEPISPFIGVVHAQEPKVVVEPIIVTPKLSRKTEGCIKNNPGIAGKIKAKFDDYALDLICRESSFNPLAINPSSKACGLAQALPCSKMKCELSNVDCQLDWIGDYVYRRYGSFENAIEFHNINNWY